MKKTLREHAKDAMLVQSACNLSAIVHSMNDLVTDLWEHANNLGKGTNYVNTHPIVQLYVIALYELSGLGFCGSDVQVYAKCQQIAEKEERSDPK